MENRFEIQGNSLIIHLPKEVDHMVTDEIRRDSDDGSYDTGDYDDSGY